MKRKLFFFLTVAFITAIPLFAQSAWPKNIPTSDGGKLTMYEPEPESLNGDQLTGRAAVSVRKSESDEPVFGVVFFTATLENSGSSGNEFSSMRVTQAKFSGLDDDALIDKYSSLIENNAAGWDLGMSDNDLREAVDREKSTTSGADFNNAAPKIIYTEKPSTLIVLDGEPKVLYDKNIEADKVVNSPNLIFKEGNQWNLYAGGNWYRSSSVDSEWKVNKSLSNKVKKVNDAVKKQEKENNNGEEVTNTPKITEIIVADEPTELLQTDGEPEYKAISGTSLLYVSNSPNEIFKDINSQKTYILIAGRWYNAPGINGPWNYVPSDELPEDFAMIPKGSDKDRVLSNVAGTDAAEDARVDAAVPQTAKVDKRTATIKVEYDGTPVFNQIAGTSLDLAENANVTVMMDGEGKYFALENGIWFVGKSAYGPWKVANDRPADIDNIPANSPAYNTKYVYIYDETPDYVYTGYTSGYLGSYYYGPTMVYGTGWHYRPWFRSVYYPRPITWGFGFLYDPWIGWNINWGYNYGFLYVGFDYGRYYGYNRYGYNYYGYGYGGGWFGPQYYCPPYRRQHYGGYYGNKGNYGYNNGYYRNSYNNRSYQNVNGNGSRPANRRSVAGNVNPNPTNGGSGWTRNYNLYNNQNGVVSQNVNRSPRVYRPDTFSTAGSNVSAPVNSRYSNRLNTNENNRTPEIRNNSNNNTNNNTVIENNRNTNRNYNPRQPQVSEPNNNNPVIERNSNTGRPQNNVRQNSGRELPRVTRPVQNENNNEVRQNQNRDLPRVTLPVESPQEERQQPVRELPRVTRPEPVEISNERPVPERVQRSLPVERQERSNPVRMERQQTAPDERPTYNRPDAPSQNRGSSSGGLQRGGRPDRR